MKFLLTLSLLLSTAFAQQARRIEVLFLGDKGHHKPIERVPQLMAALGPKGINITYTDDLNDLNPKTLGKYDALMIFANWDTLPAPAEGIAGLCCIRQGLSAHPLCFLLFQEFQRIREACRRTILAPYHGFHHYTNHAAPASCNGRPHAIHCIR